MKLSFFRQAALKPHHERLKTLFLFQGLSNSELGIVSALLHEREYLHHEVVFDEGEEGHAIYIVVEGHVVVCRYHDGKNHLIAELGPGSFFGELALLTNAPRATQVRASSNCKMLVFFRDDFNNLLHTHAVIASKIGLNLARHVGARLRESVVGRRVEHSL